MADLITLSFATPHPVWADVQAVLNILLVAGDRQLDIDKADEEAHFLHQKNPRGNPQPRCGDSLDRDQLGLK